MELFPEYTNLTTSSPVPPLAARMRPGTLEKYFGQEHLIGKGLPLRELVETESGLSFVLWGPPGSGKTTLARIAANLTKSEFHEISAVNAGVADIRKVVQSATQTWKVKGSRTILFLDEIHRFNKAQQDAVLPFVENGTIRLIGSTTQKSLRGSDPDAAIYWLAKMIAGGEDPRFIARRLLVTAAEDVGNADPQALLLALAAAECIDRLGLPEARIPLAQAVIYIAKAPKDNTAISAIDEAINDVQQKGHSYPVPDHLKDTHYRDAKAAYRYGVDYKYPHDYPENFVEQDYLPEDLKNRKYVDDSEQDKKE